MPDHRYNENGDLEEFDNGPYEDRVHVPETRQRYLVVQHHTGPLAGADVTLGKPKWTGDVLRRQMGLDPVPCPNRNENEGSAECMCFQCFKRRQSALDEQTREHLRISTKPAYRTLCCPSCRRELCLVQCGEFARIDVVKACEGCQREGRST